MNNSSAVGQKICEFIQKHPGTSEYGIAQAMGGICARATANKIIFNVLLPSEKIIDKKVGNSFHRFYINDKNQFIKLEMEINQRKKNAKRLTALVLKERAGVEPNFKNDEHFRKLVHLAQLRSYDKFTWIADKIDKYIKPPEDRQILNNALAESLMESRKLNAFLTGSNEMIRILEDAKKAPDKDKKYDELINLIMP